MDRLRQDAASLQAERGMKSGTTTPLAPSPNASKPVYNRNYFASPDTVHPPNPQYPGTLEELRHYAHDESRGRGKMSRLPFAERHRTMSGTSDAADHRPQNMRHMSAMGYAGEGKTPSFARDHPQQLQSASPPDPRKVPAFRKPAPKSRRNNAIASESDSESGSESGSDSEVSPDEETPRDKQRQSRNESKRDGSDRRGPPRQQQNLSVQPPQGTVHQPLRPTTPTGHRPRESMGLPRTEHLPSDISHDTRAPPLHPARPSPISSPTSASPRNSSYGPSPVSSRPGSRDGLSSKEDSPTSGRKAHLPQASVSADHIPLYPSNPHTKHPDESHGQPAPQYTSRPSSPTLHPPGQSSQRQHRESPQSSEAPGPRQSSPNPTPQSSRGVKPDLKIDIQSQPAEVTMKAWHGPRPEVPTQPVSGHYHLGRGIPVPSPSVPASAPFWTADHRDRGHGALQAHPRPPNSARPAPPLQQSTPSQYHHNSRPPPTRLLACPRPGFIVGRNDWWTLRNAMIVTVCPECKESLEEAGSTAQFVRPAPRPLDHPTRCDLSIPWVRMAWLLVLQGKAPKQLVGDVITGIAN